MNRINEEQLKNIKGGGVNWTLVTGIAAIASFFMGVIDGLINPQKCNK